MPATRVAYLDSKLGFLGLDAHQAGDPGDARVVVIPFGLEASVSYTGGTAQGPEAIRIASHQVELFDEELWSEPYQRFGGVATLAPFEIAESLPAAIEQIEAIVDPLLEAGRFPLVLGGEHSLTAGAIRPFVKRHEKLGILHFDAHADLRDGYEGEPYSHAAALRRCLDHPNVTLVSVGIRNISAEEIPFYEANRDRIHIHWAKDKSQWSVDTIVAPLVDMPFYLTFDLDGFDSSLMPATGTPEPGGLFWDDALRIIRAACQRGQLVGADVNELAPRPGLHACDFLAAKLAYKILAYRFA